MKPEERFLYPLLLSLEAKNMVGDKQEENRVFYILDNKIIIEYNPMNNYVWLDNIIDEELRKYKIENIFDFIKNIILNTLDIKTINKIEIANLHPNDFKPKFKAISKK